MIRLQQNSKQQPLTNLFSKENKALISLHQLVGDFCLLNLKHHIIMGIYGKTTLP